MRGVGQNGGISETDIANEGELMMSLRSGSNEHIVEIIGHGSLGVHTASYFIDMEYCGINLEEWIRGENTSVIGLSEYKTLARERQLPFIVCAILQQILSGLIFIHNHGKVHRDLKPRNSKP